MAPPRSTTTATSQRPATTATTAAVPALTASAAATDDSRSEASSGAAATTNRLPPTSTVTSTGQRSRKPGVSTTTTTTTTTTTNLATQAKIDQQPQQQEQETDELPGIPWTEMPLSVLHDYRFAYRLSTPSAYSRPYTQLLLSSGVGLRSPTAVAARRHAAAAAANQSRAGSTPSTSTSQYDLHPLYAPYQQHQQQESGGGGDSVLHRVIGQPRVSKEQLALAVRKHFNSMGVVEQDAIARFLYKVREEGRGRKFRLRFQP